MNFGRLVLIAVSAAMLVACGSAEDRAEQYLERARASMEAEDYVKAELDLKNTLQINPKSAEARLMLAEIAERDQRWQMMFNQLRSVTELDPNNTDARVKLGVVYLGLKGVGPEFLDRSREQVDAVLAIDPNHVGARVLQASLLRESGEPDQARAQVREVLREHPGDVAAVSLLASLFMPGEPENALAALRSGITANPDSAALRLLLVGLLERQGRWDEVESSLQDMIAKYPQEKGIRYKLTEFYSQQGRTDEAERELRSMMANYPDDITVKLKLAELLANFRAPEQAEEMLKAFVVQEPDVHRFRFALARLYEATQRGGEAEDIYRGIIDIDGVGSQGLEARNKLATLHLRSRDVNKARVLVDEVMAQDATNTSSLLMRAAMMMDDGELESAIADLRTVRRNEPNNDKALTLLGQAHLRNGDENLAEERFRELVQEHPNNVSGRLSLARLLVKKEQWADAEILLLGALNTREGQDVGTIRLLVDVLVRQEKWGPAMEFAERITSIEGQAHLGHYLEGRIFQAQRDFPNAVDRYSKGLAERESSIEALSGLVGSLSAMERETEALTYLERYVAAQPKSFHAHTLIGQVNARLKRWVLAKAAFEQAISINPSWLPAYRDLTGVYLQGNDTDGAIQVCKRGLDAVPGNNQMQLLLAGVYERKQDFPQAMELYETVLSSDAASTVAANNLAALIADHAPETERLEYALRVARRFEGTSNPLFLDTLGWVHYRLGNVDTAVPLLEEAVQGAGQVPQLRYHLGMAYFETERKELARRELQAAIDNSGDGFFGLEEARSTLAKL